jgi:hypothetical protein
MRRIALAAATVLAAACSGAASSSNTSATPASGGAASASATASATPCTGGACSVRIDLDPSVTSEYQRRLVNYKLFQGCPRNLGVSNEAGFRGLPAVVTSTQPNFVVPSSFQGRYGTVVRFEGPAPVQYVVVDFATNSTATVNYGQIWTGSSFTVDQVVRNTNQSFERRVCR